MTDAETPPEQGRDRRPPPDAARTAPMAVDGPPPDAVGPARPPPTGGPEAETRVAGPCTVAGADEVAVPGPDREPVPADRPDGGSDELDGVRDGPDAENGAGTRASASEGSVVEAAAATSEPVPATSEAPLPPPDVAPAAVSETLPSAGDSPHVGAESVPRAPETVPTEREAAGATAQAPPTAADPVPAAPDPVPAAPDPVPATPDPVPATPDPVPATPDPGRSPAGQLLPGDPRPHPHPHPPRTVARGRLRRAMRPRATRAQLLAGALCALLGFALVVQARQTQVQGLDSLRQADLVRVLDNVTNAEARAEQDVRDEQAIRDRLMSGTDSSAAAQEAAKQRLDTLGLLAGTVPATGPGIELEIIDPRRQVDASILLDTLEELRDGGAEVIQIGPVRVVAATAFTDEADGVRVGNRLLTPPYTYKVIGDPQTLSRLLQIPGGVLDVLHSKGAQGRVTQPATVTVDALQPASSPQYAHPAPGATP